MSLTRDHSNRLKKSLATLTEFTFVRAGCQPSLRGSQQIREKRSRLAGSSPEPFWMQSTLDSSRWEKVRTRSSVDHARHASVISQGLVTTSFRPIMLMQAACSPCDARFPLGAKVGPVCCPRGGCRPMDVDGEPTWVPRTVTQKKGSFKGMWKDG